MNPESRTLRLLVLTAVVLAACMLPASASEHTVGPAGAEFVSIRDAISWASAGDTILVESGTYPGTVILDKRVILRGTDTGSGLPVIDAGQAGDGVDIRVDGCTVEGFVLRNGTLFTGIRAAAGDTTLRNNGVSGFSQGIALISSRGSRIESNHITDNIRAGITLEASDANTITANIVSGNTAGIQIDEYSLSDVISFNTFSNSQNVVSKSKTSKWSSPDLFSYTYLGQKKQSRMGNFWSDYLGRDRNGDGIGDTPYMITTGGIPNAVLESDQNIVDGFPLMDPVEYYTGISVSTVPQTPVATRTEPVVTRTLPVSGPLPSGGSGTVPAYGILIAAALVILMVAGGYLVVFRRKAESPPLPTAALEPAGPEPSVQEPVMTGTPAAVEPVMAAPESPARNEPPRPGIPFAAQVKDRIRSLTGRVSRSTSKAVKAGTAATMPFTTRAAEVLRTVVADRSRSPASSTRPVPRTARPENLEPPAIVPAPEQKNYFPRELESKYTEIAYLGRGGIAWVFSARRKSDGIRVAVKIPISFDETTGKCFLNEIAAWETLRHENIVEVTAVNILPVPYVEMEYVPGSLESLEKPLPVWKAVHIVRGITAGLQYAHEHGFVHRDIKPHNILLTDAVVPKITDWGMSKVLAADIKKSSIAGFSLSYAAPEQVSPSEFGRTGERTDIYQLGVVFYELVTGSIPFGGESIVEVGNAILRDVPIPPSEYNPDAEAVEKIVLRCLEKDPARRYQSAAELLDALAGYLDEDED